MIKLIPTSPWNKVDTVCRFKAVVVSIPENWATTQKKLSFKWETVMAPAPIASTVRARPMAESNPNEFKIGAIIAAVVIIETVEDPWEVFKIAAIKKGKKAEHGSKIKKAKSGAKLKMVKGSDGNMVPFYAADGKGKMEYGGALKKMKAMYGSKVKMAKHGSKVKMAGKGAYMKGK